MTPKMNAYQKFYSAPKEMREPVRCYNWLKELKIPYISRQVEDAEVDLHMDAKWTIQVTIHRVRVQQKSGSHTWFQPPPHPTMLSVNSPIIFVSKMFVKSIFIPPSSLPSAISFYQNYFHLSSPLRSKKIF